jgi:hypothetical protein
LQALYCGMAWFSGCHFTNYLPLGTYQAVLCGLVAGSSVILEKTGRRIELALFVLSHALRSMARTGVMRGWWPRIPYFEVCCFGNAWLATFCFVLFVHPILVGFVVRPFNGYDDARYVSLFSSHCFALTISSYPPSLFSVSLTFFYSLSFPFLAYVKSDVQTTLLRSSYWNVSSLKVDPLLEALPHRSCLSFFFFLFR